MNIVTDRLLIRALQVNDAGTLADLWSDADVTRFMGGPRNREETYAEFVSEAEGGDPDPADALWPVIEKSSGHPIGDCGIIKKEVDGTTERELIYVFAKDKWGQGYATEAARAICDYAFDRLRLKRLIALIDPDNVASARVAEKAGMTFWKETVRPSGKRMCVYMKLSAGL